MRIVTRDSHGAAIDWPGLVAALRDGHRLPRAEIADVFLGPPERMLLSRAARIEGLGFGVKSVTVLPGNNELGLPTVQGGMLVLDHATGGLRAVIDSDLVTNLKTVADSLLGASLLARPDSRSLLILGAGTVARTLAEAYPAVFPGLDRIEIWNRSPERAEALAAATGARPVRDLAEAVARADIVAAATMTVDPILRGDWLCPGTHVDLIGAFRPDMREADDTALQRARIFVDSFDTTLGHIGELKIPLDSGAITRADVLGDLYALVDGAEGRRGAGDITLFKNGGGAHLDLMTACALLDREAQP